MTEDNETERYNTIFAQSKKSQPNEKRKKKLQKKSYPFWFYAYSLCRFFCFISQISIPFLLSWLFFKNNPPSLIYHSIPASKILAHDLGSSNLDHCSFPVFLLSVPFSSSLAIRIQLIPFVFGYSVTPFPSTKLPVFTLKWGKEFYSIKIILWVSWEKGASEEQTAAINTLKLKGQIQMNKADL